MRQKGGEEEWVEVGDRVSTLALSFSLSLCMRSRVFDLSTYALARLPQMEFVQVVLVSPATEHAAPKHRKAIAASE